MPKTTLVGVRVLIVDDHEDTRDLLGFALEIEGAEVRLAESVDQARKVLATWKPNVVVSDLTMPNEDGFALIQSLRDDSALEAVPAIALTGHAEERAKVAALRAGFTAHVAKPVDISALVTAVADLAVRTASASLDMQSARARAEDPR